MQIELPYTRRLSLIPAALALAVACGGDANEQGAATPDTVSASAAGDIGAASAISPAEAVAFMVAVDSSEIQAARVATNKATNPEVRQFAQMMIRDHTRSIREMSQLTRSIGAGQSTVGQSATGQPGAGQPPSTGQQPGTAQQPGATPQPGTAQQPGAGQPGSIATNVRTTGQQTLQQLNSTPRGSEFDRLYMDSQVQAHQTALENLQRIANQGQFGTTGTTGTAGTGTTGTAGAGTAGTARPGTGTASASCPIGGAGTSRTTGTTGTTGAGTAGDTAGAQAAHGGAAGQSATGSVTSPDQAAQNMIPVVQHHLDCARQIQSRLSGTATR